MKSASLGWLAANSTYTFKAVLNGSTLDFYINNTKELSTTDTSLSTGKIGFALFNTTAEFDDVIVMP